MSQPVHRLGPARLAALAAIALAAALALVWIGRASADEGGEPAEAVTAVSNVATGKADAVDTSDNQCTSSASFVDMPGMSETFTFGGTASRPVLVLFQGRWNNAAEGHAIIRLVIDGVVQPGPGASVTLHEDDASADLETNGFNFISAPLAPGTHTAKIQWQKFAGAVICVGTRSLIVLHK
jgi:hypothetical protein